VVDSVVALDPDVAVLVDCKARHEHRILAEAAKAGYVHGISNHPTYTGILIISKHQLTPGTIGEDRAPQRWLHARSDQLDLEIAAVYGPLVKTIGMEPAMNEFWKRLVSACDRIVDRRAILCGDFNTGLNKADGPPKYRFPGASPFNDLRAHGWRDAYRGLHPEGEHRSWWNKIRGFRIDHCMLGRGMSDPRSVMYDREVAGIQAEGSSSALPKIAAISDHAAMVIDF
jgi:exonuclease III